MSESRGSGRENRVAQTRDTETRTATRRRMQQTAYQGRLYLPPEIIPEDVVYRWVRETIMNEPDPNNMTDRFLDDWSAVPASRHPQLVPPPLPGYEGLEVTVIRRGGLMLCEKPKVFYDEDKRQKETENSRIMETINDYVDGGDSVLPRFVERNEDDISSRPH